MIKLKTITGKEFLLNNDLIYRVDVEYDTIITLINGKTLRVQDTTEEIAEKVMAFKREVMNPFERKSEQ
ncbi:flagellar FlbD family protein [Jeotgalibaca porci]|uniref:Flagellar FlbD family protein n=1 Tax=Jeotgalibaca porci TaxID=1868793 RepID=A0A6G7WHD2_9LACT|nr:flagellar FlbD family protein [Jeotgalibaca porci]QIK51608.1 flagellar FlbD family protein [Jeotgalibaca porci]